MFILAQGNIGIPPVPPVDVLAGATKHGIHEIEATAGHNTGSAEVGVGKSTHCHEGIYVDGDSE